MSEPQTIPLSEHLDSRPWSAAQKWVVGLGALAFVVDGLANQTLGVAMPAILSQWGLSRRALAPVSAAGLLGVAIGSFAGGAIGDRIGRRWGLILAVSLFAAMTIAAGFAPTPLALGILRFLGGLGLGAAIPNGAALLAETAPRNRRALSIGLAMSFIPIGGTLCGLLGALLLGRFGWHRLFVAAGLLCFAIAGLFILFLPESPSFLVLRPHRSAELHRLVRRLTGPLDPALGFYEPVPAREDLHWRGLLAPKVRRNSLGIWIGFFCCLLAAYTMFSWLPTLLHANGFSLAASSVMMTAFNGGGTAGGVLAGVMMHHFGSRRPTIGMAAAGALVALAITLLPLHPDAPFAMFVTVALLGLLVAGLHNGFYTLAADSYPSVLRGTGIGAASAFGRLGAITSSFTGALSIAPGHAGDYFIIIATALALCGLSVSFTRTTGPS